MRFAVRVGRGHPYAAVEPAVRGVVMPETTSMERAAAFTTIPACVPLIEAVTLSVAVTDQVRLS